MSMNFVNEPTRAWDPKKRLREMINEGSDAANVDKLVELLIDDGFDFFFFFDPRHGLMRLNVLFLLVWVLRLRVTCT